MSQFDEIYLEILDEVKKQSLFTYKDGSPIKHGDIVRYTNDKNKSNSYTVVGGNILKDKVQLEKNDGNSDTSPSWIHVRTSQIEKIS